MRRLLPQGPTSKPNTGDVAAHYFRKTDLLEYPEKAKNVA
jgi:hypothetical protein